MSIENDITKHALHNAIKFNGKANQGAVLGKILSEDPSLKDDIKNLSKTISEILKRVNKLSIGQQIDELKKIDPNLLDEKKETKEKDLPELNNVIKGKVKMRFEPSPSGPLHIGHAFALSLNSELCRKYNGILQLRISDTNPENIDPNAYQMIPEDAKWVTKDNVKEFVIQSDRMDSYYKAAEDIIKKGHAYVCLCKAEDFKEITLKSHECPCRNNTVDENLKRWKKMFTSYKEGDAVVRIKTNINDKNPAMRDWPALRIKEESHARQKKKYRVWPLLNFSVAIDDHQLGITHTVRAKDHMDNEKRQRFLFDHMGWKMAEHLYIGRINFIDMKVSCSKTRPLIEDGTYEGWDDIRVPFLKSLKRRGYQPEAFIKFAKEIGLTQNDKTMHQDEFFKTLNAFNREVIDSTSNRYFFIENAIEIVIQNAPKQNIELNLHPEHKKEGRSFETNDSFLIEKRDFDSFKDGKLYRLMDCLNFRKSKNKFIFDSLDHETYKNKGEKIVHWLTKKDLVKVEVLMPDHSIIKGFGEQTINKMKIGEICQFERFGFVRLDRINKNVFTFWFAHK